MGDGGKPERVGMSKTQNDDVGVYDNFPLSEAVTVQTPNLNDTNTQSQSLPLTQNGEETNDFIQQTSVNNSEKDSSDDDDDEEDDVDEVMRDEDEEEFSEGSNSLTFCQSPDIPMTDSSYSETGSLLETPGAFSPEPTSPVIPPLSKEMAHPITLLKTGVSFAEEHAPAFIGEHGTEGLMPRSTTCNTQSRSPASPSEVADRTAQTVSKQQLTSSTSTELISSVEPDVSAGVSMSSAAETFTTPPAAAGATVEALRCSTNPHTAEVTFSNSPMSSKQEQISCPPRTCTREPVLRPNLTDSLEQLLEKGDDARLPHHLHQIAEAFVQQEDYQRALCFIQLERLYHQRLLDNLSALQEEWGRRCSRMTSDLTTHPLGTLRSLCETHNWPRIGDAEFAPTGLSKSEVDEQAKQPALGLAAAMDQPNSAERQREDFHLEEQEEETQGGEDEDSEVEEASEALLLENEEEEDLGAEKHEEVDFCLKTIPVETLFSETEVEPQQLHCDVVAQEKQHEDLQENSDPSLHKELHFPQKSQMQQLQEQLEEEEDYDLEQADMIREAPTLDYMAKQITVEEISPASGLVSILKKRAEMETLSVSTSEGPQFKKALPKRRVRFKVPDDNYDNELGGGDSCLLLFLLCLVTVVISVGGTALYCAFGDPHSSVCQDFSSNADFYMRQLHRGMNQLQHWFTPGS